MEAYTPTDLSLTKYSHDKYMSYGPAILSCMRALWRRICNRLDVYLQRSSHVSQIVLCIFTGWALIYTVIPLYQKALLDEAIAKKQVELKEATAAMAKKEVELKEASAALEEAYRRIKFSAVKDFVFMTGAKCTNLLYRPMPPLGPLGKPEPSTPPPFAELFELDVPGCITKEAEKYLPLKELRPEDRKLFDQNIFTLNQELSVIRKRAKAEYDEVPQKVSANPSAFPRPTGDVGEVLKWVKKRASPEQYWRNVHELTIREEQSRIGETYGKTIRQKILRLIDTMFSQKQTSEGPDSLHHE
jgi:hypothetical protein